MSIWVAGVDGCGRDAAGGRDLWVACLRPLNEPAGARFIALTRFWDVLALEPAPDLVAVDMPIGFLDRAAPGGRACERAARSLLGPRKASVFSAPARPALAATDYAAALKANRAGGGPGVSKQCFHLFTKMREIDARLTPALQARVVEAHPELAFARLRDGAPCAHPKRNAQGRAERRAALAAAGYPQAMLDARALAVGPGAAAADDLLDACVLSWTAARIARGDALRLPHRPPVDSKGLRMEMWA